MPKTTWGEELTHRKRPWCWQRLKAGGEGDNRRWDGWMASLTRWTRVWASSASWWWTGKPGVLQSTGWQRVRHDWVTELNWTELMIPSDFSLLFGFATKFDVVATFYCTWILEGLQWVKSQSTLNVMCSCCFSATQPCPILCDSVDCSTPGFPVLHHFPELLKLMSIESVMPSNHLIFWHPLLLQPSIFPSIRVFSNESVLHIRWSRYWSFTLNISPTNEHPGLISFMMDWLDLLAVQGSLKSLLQYHSSKASILWWSAFFTVLLSHRYMITGKTIALTRHTFVDKVMSLLFNMLSRLVITFFQEVSVF